MNTQSRITDSQHSKFEIKHSWIPIVICLLLLEISYCSSESDIVTIDVHKANDLLRNSDYRYLDVRTREEFNKGHIDFNDSLNIPYMLDTPQGRVKNTNFVEQVLSLCTKDDHLVVGCKSGIRSAYATTILLDAGFKHVYNMGGGYIAWVENELLVAMKTPKIVTIDVLKANDLLRNGGYRYLDVRTEEEFKKGHVDFDDALNIPYMFNTPQGRVKNPNFMEQVLPVCTKDDHLIVVRHLITL
ncbi:hypothetical protein OSB04_027537 [Centaurea solstitialis]|uniref:Rhodanese domain-containing protein n=1 Tax=Centaurea solstitialis TaxID=347529 RepID=A0AA38SR16_9ASTR|nr:hypothetical protein OSB04_027537 [Centaurea solstitialis]